jgi:uncharacterized protein (DUF305 family)
VIQSAQLALIGRGLADRIIEAQLREIGEMKALIADFESIPPPGAR